MLVAGTVTWVDPYKGGARPTPQIEAEGRRTKPCANQLLHVRPAAETFDLDSEPLAELHTDAEGCFEMQLAPGRYHVFRSSKLGTPAWHAQQQQQEQQEPQQQPQPSEGAPPRQPQMMMMMPGGSSVADNVRWRMRPDATIEVDASSESGESGESSSSSSSGSGGRVKLHWVNDRELGTAMPC